MTPHLHSPQRLHAGNNGVYDAVFSDDGGAWFIRYLPWQALRFAEIGNAQAEYSTESYESPYAARLAWERGSVAYRVLEST